MAAVVTSSMPIIFIVRINYVLGSDTPTMYLAAGLTVDEMIP